VVEKNARMTFGVWLGESEPEDEFIVPDVLQADVERPGSMGMAALEKITIQDLDLMEKGWQV